MMARDSMFEPPRLSPESISALQDALRHCLDSDGEIESVRPALRAIALEARGRRILAEHLLITLKDVWHALPQVRQVDNEDRQKLLQRLVTLCVREYYSADAG